MPNAEEKERYRSGTNDVGMILRSISVLSTDGILYLHSRYETDDLPLRAAEDRPYRRERVREEHHQCNPAPSQLHT